MTLQLKCQDTIDKKYLVSLLYLKSDKEINHKIRSAFYFSDTSNAAVDFSVHDEIWYHPLYSFSSSLRENNWGIDSSIINSKSLFKERYYFDSIKMPLISKLLPPSDSKILLTFSKPFGNFLLAEMLDGRINSTNTFKTGRAIEFLFLFDENGLIKKVLNNITVYR
jgi:hypothetical protein